MEGLRSEESTTKAFVTFVNKSIRRADIYWINYSSQVIHYTGLRPNESTNVNTYQTHPWLVLDATRGQRLLVDDDFVYYPPPWFNNYNVDTGKITRAKAIITVPMSPLRSLAIWKIAGMVKKADTFDALELPKSVVKDLITVHSSSKVKRPRIEVIR